MTTVDILMILNFGMWVSTWFWKLTENWRLVFDDMKLSQVVFAAILMILALVIGLDCGAISIY